MKEPKIPKYWNRIWTDSRIPAGAVVLLMQMKMASTVDVLRMSVKQMSKRFHIPERTIDRYISILSKLRAITIRNNSRRGNLCESTYLIDDRHFAKYLSETAQKKKQKTQRQIGGAVPSVLNTLPGTANDQDHDGLGGGPDRLMEVPENVLYMPGVKKGGSKRKLG